MPSLQEMIGNKSLPDDFTFTAQDGQTYKLGDFRGHVSASEKRVADELAKLEAEWTKIKKAQEDVSSLYTHLSSTQGQQPASTGPQGDELAAYLQDDNWKPVVNRLVSLEKNLQSAQARFSQQVQQLNQWLWRTRYESEYFTHRDAFEGMDFDGAIKEMQSGNHMREVAPNLRVPSLVPLAESRKATAAQKKELEDAKAAIAKRSEASDKLPKPSTGGFRPNPATNTQPPKLDRRNPFAGIRDQVTQDTEIAALATQ